MYRIYQTEGIVLGSTDFGEANKYLFIFSRQFGLIKVSAQGLRNLKSKLRFALQDLSVVNLSLVQGKHFWIAVNADYLDNFYFRNKKKLFVTKSILDLLSKLLSGQEKNDELYQLIKAGLSQLKTTALSVNEIKSFESLLVLRLLFCLGYFDKNKEIKPNLFYTNFLQLNDWNKNLLSEIGQYRRKVIVDINNSLQLSQLT